MTRYAGERQSASPRLGKNSAHVTGNHHSPSSSPPAQPPPPSSVSLLERAPARRAGRRVSAGCVRRVSTPVARTACTALSFSSPALRVASTTASRSFWTRASFSIVQAYRKGVKKHTKRNRTLRHERRGCPTAFSANVPHAHTWSLHPDGEGGKR